MDDILQEIARERKTDCLMLPLARFTGENYRYLELGVFKQTNEHYREIPCPNGCGEDVFIEGRVHDGYVVTCCHRGISEEIIVSPDIVELCEFDPVVFQELVECGKIVFEKPWWKTADECQADPVAARLYLQNLARDVKREVKGLHGNPDVQQYIFNKAKHGDLYYADCETARDLKRTHGWTDSSIYTYIKQAFAGKSKVAAIVRTGKIEKKRKRVAKELGFGNRR